jgi:hypothetical protein
LTTHTITNDDSPQNVLIGHDKILKMFQTLSPHAGDAIHPVLLGRVWLVRLVCMYARKTCLGPTNVAIFWIQYCQHPFL